MSGAAVMGGVLLFMSARGENYGVSRGLLADVASPTSP